jgi:hypothetical protein
MITDPERRQWLFQKMENTLKDSKMGDKLTILQERLLKIAGEFVLFPVIEEDIDAILDRSVEIKAVPSKIVLMEGEFGKCHMNSSLLWDENKERTKIMTGYALTLDDGIWRQHSWVWDIWKKRICETSVSRDWYYGFRMKKNECEKFWSDNAW